jgi:hypothetical protein
MKVVINDCYGGFSLSKEGMTRYLERKGIKTWVEDDIRYKSMGLFTVFTVPPEERLITKEGKEFYEMTQDERIAYNKAYSEQTLYDRDVPRDDPILVQLVEEDSEAMSGRCANLKVVEIPDDVEWEIEEYDGSEWVAEKHRTWC